MEPERIIISSTDDSSTQGDDTTADSPWTETRRVKRRYLSTLDAASLIVNKMVGAGIFTTPGLTLNYTQGKRQALLLWILGAVYSAFSLLIYLDYATGMPYNGAELIYLDRVFKFTKAELLPAVLFASYFVSIYHTAGNSIAFSRLLIIAATRDDQRNADTEYMLDGALVQAFAIIALAAACFLLWVHPRTGLVLSKLLAALKLMLLFILGFSGIAAGHRQDRDGKDPTQDWCSRADLGTQSIMSHFTGFVFVVYSYGGWESACYVIGEFDKREQKWVPRTRRGAMLAVLAVGLAYTVLVIGYFKACSFDDIVKNQDDLGIVRLLADKVLSDRGAIKICIALSGLGNVVAVTYTSTKVKQAIALHHFLPFSTFLGSDKPFNTPGGALLLHFIISSIFVLAVPSNRQGYAFIIGLLAYGRIVVAGIVGLGRFKLDQVIEESGLRWRAWIPSRTFNYLTGFLLFLCNLLLCVVAVLPDESGLTQDTKPPKNSSDIPNWLWTVVVGSFLLGGLLYWSSLRALQGELGTCLGWKFTIVPVEAENELEQLRHSTRRDGTRMRYVYEEPKPGTPAYKVRQAWRWVWHSLGEVL